MEVDIREAAVRLGVSESAVCRRLRVGTLEGRRERSASGYKWVCVLPDGAYATPTLNGDQDDELVMLIAGHFEALDGLINRPGGRHGRVAAHHERDPGPDGPHERG